MLPVEPFMLVRIIVLFVASLIKRIAQEIIPGSLFIINKTLPGPEVLIPSIVTLNNLDEIIDVDDGDSIIMAQKLASELGLGVGISSGANFLGALIAQEKLGKDSIVVTVFADDNKKYLSTDLMKDEPIKDDFLSTDIELLNIKAHKCIGLLCKIK